MRVDQWLLFGHLLGVVVLFGAIAIENVTLVYTLRARTTEELRAATTFAPLLHGMFPAGAALLLGFGVAMVARSDQYKFGDAWIDLALGLLVVLAATGPLVQGRRTDAVAERARAAPAGPVPAELAARVRDPVLRTSSIVSSWLALGIVALMARKPDWTGAWLIVVAFGLIGVGASLVVGQVRPAAADEPALH